MAQWGSSKGLISQNISQTMDNQGNPIISSDTTFGASPLGYAARVQALFGLPNATFELTPPDTTATINQGNQLPYWDIQDYSAGVMSGSAIYDSMTATWGIKLNPGTATTGDYLTMTTRSYLVNDDNLSLRQKALAVVAKNGTYSSTTQWNMNLTATYYDGANTVLHSGTVATILDNTTWTSMAGTTTTGGTAINGAAQYVDLTFTLTATAPVTSSTSVTIKSVLLQTSTGAAASQSFLVKETFTSSQTWTIPTGVTQLVAVVAVGGGGGGGGGMYVYNNFGGLVGTAVVSGGAGGGAGAIYIAQGVPLSGTAVTVSVGASGSGGTVGAGTTSARSTAVVALAQLGGNGAAGGVTSWGSVLSANGGNGGTRGSAYFINGSTNAPGTPTGGTGGTAQTFIWGALNQAGTSGGNGAAAGSALLVNAGAGAATGLSVYTSIPYVTSPAAGTAGGSASNTAGTALGTAFYYRPLLGVGATAGESQFLGGGGGGGGGSAAYRNDTGTAGASLGTAGAGGLGGGGGGGAGASWAGGWASSAGTFLSGDGGGATPYSGGGGGGGGGLVFIKSFDGSAVTSKAGTGGPGASGAVYIWYVG